MSTQIIKKRRIKYTINLTTNTDFKEKMVDTILQTSIAILRNYLKGKVNSIRVIKEGGKEIEEITLSIYGLKNEKRKTPRANSNGKKRNKIRKN